LSFVTFVLFCLDFGVDIVSFVVMPRDPGDEWNQDSINIYLISM